MTLDHEDIEAIAQRLAGLLQQPVASGALVGVPEVARHLGVSEGWVYRTPGRLGVKRVGRRLRFDLTEVDAALEPSPVAVVSGSSVSALPHGVRLLRGRSQSRQAS